MPKWICPKCGAIISYMSADKAPGICSVCKADSNKKETKKETINKNDKALIETTTDIPEIESNKKGYKKKFSYIKGDDEKGFGTGLEVDK